MQTENARYALRRMKMSGILFIFFYRFFFIKQNDIRYSYKTRKITYLIINLVKKDNQKRYTPADGLPVPTKKI